MKEKIGFIYKLEAPNGKVYIGQTYNITNRLKDYFYGRTIKQKLIHRSLNKYKWENFKIEILYAKKCSQQYLDSLEEKYIKKYKKLKISLNIADKANHPNTKKGKDVYNARAIYQCDLKGNILNKFNCIKEVNKLKNISSSNVTACLNRKTHYAHNYLWDYVENYNKKNLVCTYKNRPKRGDYKKRKIIQLNKNKEIINIFDSIILASKQSKISKGNIDRCLSKRGSSAGGFYWEYECNRNNIKIKPPNYGEKAIIAINIITKQEYEFLSIKEAANKLKVSQSTINNVLKSKTKKPMKYDFKYKRCP